jgi:biotin carboxylase
METHVFAWKCDDAGETDDATDFFYPISIVECDEILDVCRRIGIDGICSIASDLAAITVNHVAHAMGLPGNSPECAKKSTNKHLMRMAFEENHDPSPRSFMVETADNLERYRLNYPVIVKPTDRSGSRGITKLLSADGLKQAVECAIEQSFEKKALIEEFAGGREYSVEYISYHGEHHFLAMTLKYTTGAPHFIETAHLQPAPVSDAILDRVKAIVEHALDTLEITDSASHSEVKITDDGRISIIEIGGRMGGDFIGSNMVELSSGIDFLQAVISVALGDEPDLNPVHEKGAAAVRFIFGVDDLEELSRIESERPEYLVYKEIHDISGEIKDSSDRHGVYLLHAENVSELERYMPLPKEE